MSVRRLVSTTTAMAAVAWVLALLTPSFAEMTHALLSAQRTADSAGAEALVLAGAGLLAWGVWAWGALGLLLTAVSALPGALGDAADTLTGVVLPRGARRGAALALGIGLGVAGPLAGTTLVVVTAPAASADVTSAPVPDWPGALPGHGALPDRPGDTGGATGPVPGPAAAPSAVPALPDWPAPPAAGDHVVVRGDCLWDIAAAHLSGHLGRAAAAPEIARATSAWWAANAAVIGPDPDVLLPGQVLRPPSA
jgi:nucleoid-associated protein YgaU